MSEDCIPDYFPHVRTTAGVLPGKRDASVKELLVLSNFSVTVTLGRLKFLVPQFFCGLYDYDKEHPNIPVWSYVIYIHSILCF